MVRSGPSHGSNTGSNPVGNTILRGTEMPVQLGSKYFYTSKGEVLTLSPTGRYVKEKVSASFRDPEYDQDKFEFIIIEEQPYSDESSRLNHKIWLIEDDVQEIFELPRKNDEVKPVYRTFDMSAQMENCESQFDK